jgi:peptide/nickel transport system substrate-binding protein
VNPGTLRDVRVRRAFAHAIDRDQLNQAVYLGESIITDTPLPASLPYAGELERVVPRYGYDVRRVEQLMTEAGYTRGSDGTYVGPDQGRLSVEIRANSTAALVQEMAIIAAGWREAGFDTREMAVPVAQSTDQQVRGSFPAFYVGQGGSDETIFASFTTQRIGNPQNNWVGSNRGGFSHAEFDRLYEAFSRSLDRAERSRVAVELARIMGEEVASISLVFQVNSVAFVKGLKGPGTWGPGSSLTWNMSRWEWE